jgi:hypothetical protein
MTLTTETPPAPAVRPAVVRVLAPRPGQSGGPGAGGTR